MQTLALHDHPARRWEPKRLRLRIFSLAGVLAVTGRTVSVHLSARSPWADLAVQALTRLRAITAATTTRLTWPGPVPTTPAQALGRGSRRHRTDTGAPTRPVRPKRQNRARAGAPTRRINPHQQDHARSRLVRKIRPVHTQVRSSTHDQQQWPGPVSQVRLELRMLMTPHLERPCLRSTSSSHRPSTLPTLPLAWVAGADPTLAGNGLRERHFRDAMW